MSTLNIVTIDKNNVNNVNNIINIIREFSDYINNTLNFKNLKGIVYFQIHNLIIFFVLYITFFNNSIVYLFIILLIVSLDAFSIVVLHECPLTTLEKKYLGISSCDIRNDFLYNSKICYKCDHNYDKQIELLINVWCIIVLKILCIIFLNTFKIKLVDFNNIYN